MNLPFTKIVATIGPATWDDKIILQMIQNGFVVARINASFADYAELERVSTQLRRLSPRVAIMLDTMGQKIRVTGFTKPFILHTGDNITLMSEQFKNGSNVIKVTYPQLHKDVTRGTQILLDDGNLELKVKDIQGNNVLCTVLHGGELKPKKTVNIPKVHLSFPSLTEKDQKDIKYAVENGFDYISASFVRNTDDVALVRNAMGNTKTKLIAKIEDEEGVKNFDSILDSVDGIMVARGDLGIEMPQQQIPVLQKQFIYKCRAVGKPVIVATQMLESMRENKRPTRAEISDVANSVMDGADALMLSAETSTGKFPVEAVKTMAEVALEVEPHMLPQVINSRTSASEETDTICRHIYSISNELGIKGVIVFSQSGKTVLSLSRHRLSIPIWSISSDSKLIRQQQLLRGVTGYFIENIKRDRDEAITQAVDTIFGKGHLDLEDKVIVLSGSSITNKKNNSIIEIVTVMDVIR